MISTKRTTFVTGNKTKADYMAKFLGMPIKHINLELDEIQSLDLKKIVEHKLRQAFKLIKHPVVVEDVSLEFKALGGLPGTFVKFFVERVPFKTLCSAIPNSNRLATARCVIGFYDGVQIKLFEGGMQGKIAKKPQGTGGFGWDKIFIPKGYKVTRAALSKEDDKKTYLKIKPLSKLKKFLEEYEK